MNLTIDYQTYIACMAALRNSEERAANPQPFIAAREDLRSACIKEVAREISIVGTVPALLQRQAG